MATTNGRFQQGALAGVGATLAAGVVSLLLLRLHLWPSGRPLSIMMAQTVMNERWGLGVSSAVLYLFAGGAQLIYGAFCGGMLAFLVQPMTRTGALGMGALRWSTTQVLVAPALGWGDFGLLAQPWISVYTLLPHLAWAVTAAWLVTQEERGHVPSLRHLPHLHFPHFPARLRRAFAGHRRH
jgi:hypothetical protein